MADYIKNNCCFSCLSQDMEVIIELGEQPLANNLAPSPNASLYPLTLVRCRGCNLFQLKEVVRPEILFSGYLYRSSISSTLVTSARNLIEKILTQGTPTKVLEIGSNDGYLLRFYTKYNVACIAVEPSLSFVNDYNNSGIHLVSEFFSAELSEVIKKEHGCIDVIHANNVLAHIPDIRGVFSGIKNLLSKNGVAIVEVQYFYAMIRDSSFDMIYHEHLLYYSISSFRNLMAISGLNLFDCEFIPIHGESVRFYISKDERDQSSRLLESIETEKNFELDSRFSAYRQSVLDFRLIILLELNNLIKTGEIVAYGASAKTTVLFNYLGVSSSLVLAVIDKNPHKQGNFIPGTDIWVRDVEWLIDKKPKYLFITVWNLAVEVYAELKVHLPDTKFFYIEKKKIIFI